MLHADVKSKQARVEFIFKQGIKLSEKVEKKLRAQMHDMKKKSPKPQPLNPQEVALGGVLRDGYLIYSQLSADAAHPSLESLNRHIIRMPDDERIIDVVPVYKDVELTQTWEWACNAMLGICVGVNQMLEGTPAGLRLWEIADRYEALTRS